MPKRHHPHTRLPSRAYGRDDEAHRCSALGTPPPATVRKLHGVKPVLSPSFVSRSTLVAAAVSVIGGVTACGQSDEGSSAENVTPITSSGPSGGTMGLAGSPAGGGMPGVTLGGAGGANPGATGSAGAPGATGGGPPAPGATGGAGAPGATGDTGGNDGPGVTDETGDNSGSNGTTGETGGNGATGEAGDSTAPGASTELDTSTTDSETTTGTGDTTGMDFSLTGPWAAGEDCTPMAKDPCDDIPVENRATMIGGQNVMPTITWTAGPEGTQSYAVVYQDLSNGFAHWALWNIPPDVHSVGPDTIPAEASQSALLGQAWFGSGACENVYQLSVYALSEPTLTPGGGQAHTTVRDQLDNNEGAVVLASDFARVTPKPPCAQ